MEIWTLLTRKNLNNPKIRNYCQTEVDFDNPKGYIHTIIFDVHVSFKKGIHWIPLQICRYSILQQWNAWSIIAESFHLQNERSRGFPRDKEFLDCSALISFNISDISVDLKLKWEYQVLASLGARWGQIRWQQRSDYPWIGTENYAWGHFFLSVCREAPKWCDSRRG